MKILVADDDKKTSDFIRKGLMELGHTVDCVADGRDALSDCLYNQYELLILDRMMPGMDGLAVLKALRAARKPASLLPDAPNRPTISGLETACCSHRIFLAGGNSR